MIHFLKFNKVCFVEWLVDGYRNILEQNCRSLAFTLYKDFLKTKRALELVSLLHFLHHAVVIFFWLPLLREIIDNMCIVIICQPACDVTNFEINLVLVIKPFFST